MDAKGIVGIIDEYIEVHRAPLEAPVSLSEDEILGILSGLEEGPWRVYPNPMRSDGVFLCVEEELKPYPGVRDLDGNPVSPAVPEGLCWPVQLSHAMAYRLAGRLGVKGS